HFHRKSGQRPRNRSDHPLARRQSFPPSRRAGPRLMDHSPMNPLAAVFKPSRWTSWLWAALLVVAWLLLLKSDLAQVDWVANLSAEGSPAPKREAASP